MFFILILKNYKFIDNVMTLYSVNIFDNIFLSSMQRMQICQGYKKDGYCVTAFYYCTLYSSKNHFHPINTSLLLWKISYKYLKINTIMYFCKIPFLWETEIIGWAFIEKQRLHACSYFSLCQRILSFFVSLILFLSEFL